MTPRDSSVLPNAAGEVMWDAGIRCLAKGSLYALQSSYAVNGELPWHDREARGYSPVNCYLLVDGTSGLLIDTGLTAHREVLLAQLSSLARDLKLTIGHTRIGEFNGTCNTIAIARAFDVRQFYSQQRQTLDWIMYLPQDSGPEGPAEFGHIAQHHLPHRRTVDFGQRSERRVEAFMASLRLLPTHWFYDSATKTMFTADSFSYGTRPDRLGEWTVAEQQDLITIEQIAAHMVDSRYWWMPQADLSRIRREVAEVFDSYDIETLAPAYGCILHGKDVVRRHFRMLDEILSGSLFSKKDRSRA